MQIAVAILVGVNRIKSYIEKIIKAFKARVLSYPNSIFEAEVCLVATLKSLNAIELLDNASLIITPNAYNEGILYDVIPNTTLGDMDVVRATTATRVNSAGLIESVAVNIPRLDYTNGSCPSILVEPQRTNLLTYSEDFSNVIWTKAQSGITSNVTTAPNGILNASRLTGTGINGQHNINQSLSFTISSIYTFTSYVKIDTNNFVQLVFPGPAFGTNAFANFDLLNGVLGTVGTSASATIVNVGNGWFRCSVTSTAIFSATTTVFIALVTSATSARLQINTLSTSLYLWGTQLEVGSYKTSYIPTVASTVTRNADFISKTGISSLIGQTEGTIFIDFKLNGNSYSDNTNLYYFTIAKNSPFNFFEIIRYNNSLLYFIALNGTGIGPRVLTAFSDLNGRYKFAVSYNASGLKCFLNGTLIYTSTDNIPPCDEVNFGDYDSFVNQTSNFNSVQLYKTVLTDTECINLTTL